MQVPRVLIIAAPFGFGPAAQSVMLAHGLRTCTETTISADRDAYEFIARHKSSGTRCVRGPFSKVFANRQSLSDFDFFISVNHFPAIQHLARCGLASRTIFLDSLLPWRMAEDPATMPPRLLAYLVQDYPGVAEMLDRCAASLVALTAPLMWPLAQDVGHDARRDIIVHLGGMTSPLAPWDTIAKPVARLLSHISQLADQYGLSLTVIGSSYLKTLSPVAGNANILGDVSPEATAQLIKR